MQSGFWIGLKTFSRLATPYGKEISQNGKQRSQLQAKAYREQALQLRSRLMYQLAIET
jgi:hypothetical protein